tara:strand:+ start:1055 stop:1507 length:453 start_codon:yes stop_codon:yes gene_type:complete
MASLISDTEKANLTGIFGDIFDTFSRDVYIYKQPQQIVPSGATIDTAFIFGYEQGTWNAEYTYEYSSGVYPAVIKYDSRLESPDYGDVGIDQPVVVGSIKVKENAKTFIEDDRPVERVTVDGKDFKIVGQGRLQAFLNSKFYIFRIESLK